MTEDQERAETAATGAPPVSPYGTKGLEAYLATNRGRYTDEALRQAAVATGWDAEVVETSLRQVAKREAVAPLRARVRRIALALYVGTFAVLTLGMAMNQSSNARSYGASTIGVVILAFALAVAYALARFWFRNMRVGPAMSGIDLAVLLSVPVILWLGITGICLSTGLPIPQPA